MFYKSVLVLINLPIIMVLAHQPVVTSLLFDMQPE